MPAVKRVNRLRTRLRTALTKSSLRRPRDVPEATGRSVNDIHSQLNRTRVSFVLQPDSVEALQSIVKRAKAEGRALSVAGGRHAMGGQQFGTDALLVDLSRMNRVLRLDPRRREVETEAGIQWPELMSALVEKQRGGPQALGIIQKQTGADRLSLGGALAA